MLGDSELRDRCCWKRCRQESGTIYMGAGLCDSHWETACSVYLPTREFILKRVIPQAAATIAAQHSKNLKAAREKSLQT